MSMVNSSDKQPKPDGGERMAVTPRKPASIDPLAERILVELARTPEASQIVLGGYFALQHYAEYRRTNDIDAWWRERAQPAVESRIREVMQRVAVSEGSEYGERRFGETLSFELLRNGRKYFSFQIAVRSVELEPPVPSPWPPILLETLSDNIGAKMNALVGRGSPRDFTDIHRVVSTGLATAADCWELWRRKNSGQTIDDAKRTVVHHFAAIERRRPLDSIRDENLRRNAESIRLWVRQQLLGCL